MKWFHSMAIALAAVLATTAQRSEAAAPVSGKSYYIWNVGAGQFLGLDSAPGTYGTPVRQKSSAPLDAKWQLVPGQNGSWKFKNASSGMVMDVPGDSRSMSYIQQYQNLPYHGNQEFWLYGPYTMGGQATAPPVEYYYIQARNSGLWLDGWYAPWLYQGGWFGDNYQKWILTLVPGQTGPVLGP